MLLLFFFCLVITDTLAVYVIIAAPVYFQNILLNREYSCLLTLSSRIYLWS
jgi:hypothetical protein